VEERNRCFGEGIPENRSGYSAVRARFSLRIRIEEEISTASALDLNFNFKFKFYDNTRTLSALTSFQRTKGEKRHP
jgi:hypothetical protein